MQQKYNFIKLSSRLFLILFILSFVLIAQQGSLSIVEAQGCVDEGDTCAVDIDCCGDDCRLGICVETVQCPHELCPFDCSDVDFNQDEIINQADLDVCTASMGNGVDDPCEDNSDLQCIQNQLGPCSYTTDCQRMDFDYSGIVDASDAIVCAQRFCNENVSDCCETNSDVVSILDWIVNNPLGICPSYCPDSSTYCLGEEPLGPCGSPCPDGTKYCPNTNCAVSITSCPTTVDTEDNFQVNYEFKGTGVPFPYEVRTRLGATIPCIYDEDYAEDVWHSESATFTCSATPGTYDFTVKCRGMDTISSSNCNVDDFSDTCSVQCVESGYTSIGHIRIQGPTGLIKLNMIASADAISAGKGVLKVAIFAGDTGSAADLVETSDPDASPVRIMTPFGIKAWRKID